MRRHIFFGLLLLGIIVVSVAPVAAGEWVIRLFSWSRAPSRPVVVYQGTHQPLDCSGAVEASNCAGAVLEVAPTCSGAAFYLEAATCAGFSGADADDDDGASDFDDDADD